MPKPKTNVKKSDIAELKKLKEQNLMLKEELEIYKWANKKTNEGVKILYKELEKKNEELKRFDQLKSQFVANVSHEFKNPLAVVKESLELIYDGTLGEVNPKQKEMIESAKRTISRLVRLVTDLLDLSKIERGRLKMKREKVDILLLIDEILKLYETESFRKQISIKKDIPGEIAYIWADRDKLSEVIINLLNNAIKYTQAGGNICVKIREANGDIRIEISDNGPGIQKKDLEKIFDKFERVTAERKEGTGLGLPIAKDIVQLHRGKIRVESEVGKGSNFIVSLPRDLREKR